jgi:choline dehydrogenase
VKLISLAETLLVVECGEVEYARGIFDPPDIEFGATSGAPRPGSFNYQSLPNLKVKNKTAAVLTGKTVGGSSAINGMVFDRPSRFDFDAWVQAAGPDFNAGEHRWDWDGISPYYKKVGIR